MTKILTVIFILVVNYSVLPQLAVATPELKPETTFYFGKDIVLLGNEPIGVISGIQNSLGTIYVAINDTQSTYNLGLVIRKSTDRGKTWITENGINHRDIYGNIKLLRNSRDSIYCIFQIGSGIYSWKIDTEIIDTFNTRGYRTFDAEITSSESIYLFLDSINTDHLFIYASTDGGKGWRNRRLVSEHSASVKVAKSNSGDTLFVNYYGPVLFDTSKSILRTVRYYETSPGYVFYSGFKDLALEQSRKREFFSAASKGIVWFIYTLEENGKEIMYGMRSSNNGSTYDERMIIAPAERNNQSWFNLKSKFDNQGFNLIYFSEYDSVDHHGKIISANVTQNGTDFMDFTTINDSTAIKSTLNYKPIIIPLPFDSTFGYVWVGDTDEGKKVFWDSDIVSNIETNPEIKVTDLQLQQNYPNPFNSNTMINYYIPEEGNVSITVYDILGSSRGQVINKIQKAGEYSFNFNADKFRLESGVYFYNLIFTGLNDQKNIINTKKFIYLK